VAVGSGAQGCEIAVEEFVKSLYQVRNGMLMGVQQEDGGLVISDENIQGNQCFPRGVCEGGRNKK
jgi:hypothetical protein